MRKIYITDKRKAAIDFVKGKIIQENAIHSVGLCYGHLKSSFGRLQAFKSVESAYMDCWLAGGCKNALLNEIKKFIQYIEENRET